MVPLVPNHNVFIVEYAANILVLADFGKGCKCVIKIKKSRYVAQLLHVATASLRLAALSPGGYSFHIESICKVTCSKLVR